MGFLSFQNQTEHQVFVQKPQRWPIELDVPAHTWAWVRNAVMEQNRSVQPVRRGFFAVFYRNASKRKSTSRWIFASKRIWLGPPSQGETRVFWIRWKPFAMGYTPMDYPMAAQPIRPRLTRFYPWKLEIDAPTFSPISGTQPTFSSPAVTNPSIGYSGVNLDRASLRQEPVCTFPVEDWASIRKSQLKPSEQKHYESLGLL